jgi:uncharacterized membrane protein YbhN (UPF0104 family)
MRRMSKRFWPWVLAIGLLVLVFQRVSTREFLEALGRADLNVLLPTALTAVLSSFLVDAHTLKCLISRFHIAISGAEARSLRALTYVLAIVNWNLGTAGIVLHLKRTKGVNSAESTSTLLLYSFLDGLTLSALALFGTKTLAAPPLGLTRAVLAVFSVYILLSLSFVLPASMGLKTRILRSSIFHTPKRLRIFDVAQLACLRILFFSILIVYFWLGLPAFNVVVPLGQIITTVPLLVLIGSLPITPAGLGTQQAAMLYFYEGYGTPPAILAFGLTFPVIFVGLRALLALVYISDLTSIRKSLADGSTEAISSR